VYEKEDQQDPLRDLAYAIRRLARAGSAQAALFPDENVSATDLVRDFDQCAAVVRELYEDRLTPLQIEALTALDQKLSTMSRDGAEFDADMWTEDAVRTSEHWADVRWLAANAADAFSKAAE
jgi:hypothetical protein